MKSGSLENNQVLKLVLIGGLWFIDMFVGCLITFFLRFHLKLIRENKTTIENIDKKGLPFQSKYDMGEQYNLF